MIELFTRKKHKLNYPISQPYTLEYVRNMFYHEMSRIAKYYYENVIYIKSDHILVRTMESMLPDINDDLETFYFNALGDARRVSSAMGFSTISNNGSFFKNLFFKNSKDIILSSDYMLSSDELSKYDKEYDYYAFDYVPCRVIYTRDVSLDLALPNGETNMKTMYSINVYELNLVCLCLEYRCWAKTMMDLGEDYNIKRYIGKIVLPKMIFNKLNLAVFNRYIYGIDSNIKPERAHPFAVMDLSQKLTNIINSIKKTNDDAKKPLVSFIDNIPCIFNDKTSDALFINNNIYTRSNSWVLWLARLPYIVGILKNIGVNGIITNRSIVNGIPMYIREMYNNSIILLNMLPSVHKEEYLEYLEYIKYIHSKIFKR